MYLFEDCGCHRLPGRIGFPLFLAASPVARIGGLIGIALELDDNSGMKHFLEHRHVPQQI